MQDPSHPPASRWTLSDLPLAARLTIAVFLLAVGVGYVGAVVNLHLAEATPGNALPTPEDVRAIYHGKTDVSQFERLLVAHPTMPFNGSGSMRRVFTVERASGKNKELKRIAKKLKLNLDDPDQRKHIEAECQKCIDGERLALIAWAHDGFDKKAYEDDAYIRPPALVTHDINPKWVNENNTVKIKSIIEARCVGCHSESAGGPASQYPLDTYEDISHYTQADKTTGKSLAKLALTTHVHLLGFSMLYIMTGLALAMSSCPAWIRVPVAPLALIASVVDVACWWLARLDEPYGPMFADGIALAGGVVAGALLLQIVLTTFSLFGNFGKLVLLLLFGVAAAGGYYAKEKIVDPHLLNEREMMKAISGSPVPSEDPSRKVEPGAE